MKLNKILLLINIFLLQSYLIRFDIGPYPSNLQEVLMGLNALAFLGTTNLKKIIEGFKKHWIISILISLAALSTVIVDIQNGLDFIRHSKFLLFASILSFIFLETFKSEDEKAFGLKIMGLGALCFGLFSVIYNLLGYNISHDQRLLGPLDSAVYLAYYLTPFFLFFLFNFFEQKTRSSLIYSALLGLLIFATRSMGAIGGSLVIISVYLIQTKDLLRKRNTKILLTFVIVLTFAAIFYTKILPTINTEYSSLDERGQIWATSMELLQNPKNLLSGVGFGQFEFHYIEKVKTVLGHEPLDFKVLQPHNIFLLFIFNFGILGLFFLAYLIGRISSVVLKFDTRRAGSPIKLICAYIMLYFFIHGLIDTPFFKNDILVLIILFSSLGLEKEQA
ncbi:O-antigen ligase family protein [Candidatus Peregrinibacteria bacterium]|nr:O-antigen ligase family protein [Candidatus Peregrinibacteria bacterium]